MSIDLNHGSGFTYGAGAPSLNARLNALIDRALVAQNEAQPKRTYLGGSRIGEACSRRLVYEYTHTPHDPDKAFSGQTLRIFAAGHQFEELSIRWIRAAGTVTVRPLMGVADCPRCSPCTCGAVNPRWPLS